MQTLERDKLALMTPAQMAAADRSAEAIGVEDLPNAFPRVLRELRAGQ